MEKKKRRVQNTKAKGSQREMKVFARLNALDYYSVRSAGSHGIFDIVATYMGDDESVPIVRMVQSKSNNDVAKAMTELRLFRNTMKNSRVSIELWDWIDGFREQVITVIGKTKEEDLVLFDGRSFTN